MLENLKSYSLMLKVKHLIGISQMKMGRGANHEPSHNANSSVICEASPPLLILACTEAFLKIKHVSFDLERVSILISINIKSDTLVIQVYISNIANSLLSTVDLIVPKIILYPFILL